MKCTQKWFFFAIHETILWLLDVLYVDTFNNNSQCYSRHVYCSLHLKLTAQWPKVDLNHCCLKYHPIIYWTKQRHSSNRSASRNSNYNNMIISLFLQTEFVFFVCFFLRSRTTKVRFKSNQHAFPNLRNIKYMFCCFVVWLDKSQETSRRIKVHNIQGERHCVW